MVSKFILLMSNLVSRRLNSFKFSAVDSLLNRLFHAIPPLYRMEFLVLLVDGQGRKDDISVYSYFHGLNFSAQIILEFYSCV